MRYSIVGSLTVVCLLGLGIDGAAIHDRRNIVRRSLTSTTWKPEAFSAASEHTVSSHVLELSKKKSSSKSKRRSAAFLSGRAASASSTSLVSLVEGEDYATSITLGTQTFTVILDTGSSDTWVVEKNFTCLGSTAGSTADESDCGFGDTYTIDSTFKQIEGEEFSIGYADGEMATGIMGTENVTLAGITVSQEIGVVDSALWFGDGTTSGLTGFAYPALTSAYSTGKNSTLEVYNPIFTTMYKEGLVSSLFSLAISRNVSGPGGYLALGGLPSISFNQTFTTTPILITSVDGYSNSLDFYTINIDGVTLNGNAVNSSGGSDIQYIVDSGTTMNYYPTSVANAVNNAFDPPATYSDDDAAYVVDCNATAPAHGVTINGTTFIINALDMILNTGTDDDGNTICTSGINDGGDDIISDLYVLGDTFQKNAVIVFDVGASEMRFAPHESYASNDPY